MLVLQVALLNPLPIASNLVHEYYHTMSTSFTWTAAIGGAALTAVFLLGCWIKKKRRLVASRKALHGKVVLITGASSGLGEGSCRPIT